MSLDDHKFNIFEWLFESLNKRLGPPYNCKIQDFFLVVPYPEEAEFEYDLTKIWNHGAASGNVLVNDYPYLNKELLKRSATKLRVFFVRPDRCLKTLLLHTSKYKYPKVEQVKGIPQIIAEDVARRVDRQINFLLN